MQVLKNSDTNKAPGEVTKRAHKILRLLAVKLARSSCFECQFSRIVCDITSVGGASSRSRIPNSSLSFQYNGAHGIWTGGEVSPDFSQKKQKSMTNIKVDIVPHLFSARVPPPPLTVFVASLAVAPASRSFATAFACLWLRASCSGVASCCEARQRSGTHPISPRK